MMSEQANFQVLHEDPFRRVELALDDLRQGKMVILVDDEDRENEGDLVMAGSLVTPEGINFMAVHARGLICLSMTGAQVDRLGLPMMATNNQSAYNTAFTVSIEAREGVSTGISAADRAHTIKVAIQDNASMADIVTPGHIFPLRARDAGVLERVGQTEGSVDLARLAGLNPSAVICEIMNPDGTMARMPELKAFGEEHGLRIVAVADIIKYRMQNERVVEELQSSSIDLGDLGEWQLKLYRGKITRHLHMALIKGDIDAGPTLCRVQAAPPAWSFLGSVSSLEGSARKALEKIAGEGKGALVLMHLGGGSNEALERSWTKDFGTHTGDSQRAAAEALQDLGAGCQILSSIGFQELRLITASSRPLKGIDAFGLHLRERVSLA